MNDRGAMGRFFRAYAAARVGDTPPQPFLPIATDEETSEGVDPADFDVEMPGDKWTARIVGEAPAKLGEHPERFIDGSLLAQPVLCLRAPEGWPIPVLVSELGAVALASHGRCLVREFAL